MKPRWRRLLFIVPIGIAAIVLFALFGGEIVMQLWNWLLPPLFGWRLITFWQAIGILALCRILFGGLGRHGHSNNFRGRMRRRCSQMTPEERERFRQGMRSRWGFGPSTGDSQSPEQK